MHMAPKRDTPRGSFQLLHTSTTRTIEEESVKRQGDVSWVVHTYK